MTVVTGLAPHLPPHRPRANARWWVARGEGDPMTVSLTEQEELPEPKGKLAIAAPCSLPQEFLAYLKTSPASRTTRRLLADARAFASRRKRGDRHPKRHEGEALSALDRRRLPLFHAALPLLHLDPVEVEPAALLKAHGLPCTGLSGSSPQAVQRRVRILDALHEGALGVAVAVRERNYAIASHHALFAVLAAAAAAKA